MIAGFLNHEQYYGEGSLTKSKELFVTNFDSRVVKGYNLSWYSMVPVYVVVYRFSIMLHSTESHSIMTSRLRRNSDHFWSRIFKQWRWWRWWPWNCPYWTSERFGDSERKEEERWVEDLFEDFGEHLSPIGWFICIWNNLSSPAIGWIWYIQTNRLPPHDPRYGQTGAGKTFTMYGTKGPPEKNLVWMCLEG